MREPVDIPANKDTAIPDAFQSGESHDHCAPSFIDRTSPFLYYEEVLETQSGSNDWQTIADYKTSQFTFSSPGQVDGKFGDQSQVQHYHHTPFNLRQPGASYSSAGQRRPSDAISIMHRESAVRCANSPGPPYQSQGYHNGAPFRLQSDINTASYSQVDNLGYDARLAMSRPMDRGRNMSVPLGSPQSPSASRRPDARPSWVDNYSIGGTL